MAAFALFSMDDLARMVGKAMQQRAGDNRIAGQLAKEFQQAGIALADLPPSYYQIGINCKYNHNSYGGECKYLLGLRNRRMCNVLWQWLSRHQLQFLCWQVLRVTLREQDEVRPHSVLSWVYGILCDQTQFNLSN